VDGYFETVPSVWHKEILWALSQGIHVFGSSSMGALRAAELSVFGMRGIGKVFEDYRDGVLHDDDEVCLLHAPEELDYSPLTDAMVNMRATLDKAVFDRAVEESLGAALLQAAKSLFFKCRTWEAAAQTLGASRPDARAEIHRVSQFLRTNLVDRKRQDAISMLNILACMTADAPDPISPKFSMAKTAAWFKATARHEC
jgi:hypothetical protein